MGMHMGHPGHIPHMTEGEDEETVRSVPDMVLAARMLKYLLVYRKQIAIVIGTVIAATLLRLMPPYLIGLAMDSINLEKQVNIQIFSAAIIGFGVVAIFTFLANYVSNG